MTIPQKLIKQGAKATSESWRDNYQSPEYIISLINQFYEGVEGEAWRDPFPINPQFDLFKLHMTYSIGVGNWPRMYVNPPFSRYSDAVEKLLWLADYCEQIWILDNVKTETKYAQKLLSNSTSICFLKKRVNFIDPRTGKKTKGNRSGQILIYSGNRQERFREVFSDLGVVKI